MYKKETPPYFVKPRKRVKPSLLLRPALRQLPSMTSFSEMRMLNLCLTVSIFFFF
jgi:hypothetical protein